MISRNVLKSVDEIWLDVITQKFMSCAINSVTSAPMGSWSGGTYTNHGTASWMSRTVSPPTQGCALTTAASLIAKPLAGAPTVLSTGDAPPGRLGRLGRFGSARN